MSAVHHKIIEATKDVVHLVCRGHADEVLARMQQFAEEEHKRAISEVCDAFDTITRDLRKGSDE